MEKDLMNLKWIEPETRWIMKTFFRRNFDAFTEEARRMANWGVLGADIAGLWVLLQIL